MLLKICSCWTFQAKAQTLRISPKWSTSMEASQMIKRESENNKLKMKTITSYHKCKAQLVKANLHQNSQNKLRRRKNLIIKKLKHHMPINGRRLTFLMRRTKRPKPNSNNSRIQHSQKYTKTMCLTKYKQIIPAMRFGKMTFMPIHISLRQAIMNSTATKITIGRVKSSLTTAERMTSMEFKWNKLTLIKINSRTKMFSILILINQIKRKIKKFSTLYNWMIKSPVIGATLKIHKNQQVSYLKLMLEPDHPTDILICRSLKYNPRLILKMKKIKLTFKTLKEMRMNLS